MTLEHPTQAVDSPEVKKEKDKMDLRPAIDFIEKNQGAYHQITRQVQEYNGPRSTYDWARTLKFEDEQKVRGPQISSTEACQILSTVPEALAALSKLRTVSYSYGDQIIEPVYNPDGTLKTGNTVDFDEFGKHQEHPTRVLVGVTPFSGETIYMSALPSTVYKDAEAARLYQQHVLLHEFFHTVEIAIRDPHKRGAIQLETDGQHFSLQDWWKEFEDFTLSRAEKLVSRYGAGYEHDLTDDVRTQDNDKFTHALAEQICESFVAYQQNIIPNDDNLTNFKESWPRTWKIMDRLCRAKVIKSNDKITT